MFRVNRNTYNVNQNLEINFKGISDSAKNADGETVATPDLHSVQLSAELTNDVSTKVKFRTKAEGSPGQQFSTTYNLEPNENTELKSKETVAVDGTTEIITATMSTKNENVSPVIDTDRLSMVGTRNELTSLNSDETTPESSTPTDSSGSSRFIAGRVNLDTPANAIKVSVTAYKPKGTDFQVYMKYLPEGKNNFDEQKWNLLDVQPNSNPTIPNKGEFYEFEYLPPNGKFESKFKQFATKIVMVGEAASGTVADAPESPIIKDMKAVVYSKSTP
jgi:hypothetical protein